MSGVARAAALAGRMRRSAGHRTAGSAPTASRAWSGSVRRRRRSGRTGSGWCARCPVPRRPRRTAARAATRKSAPAWRTSWSGRQRPPVRTNGGTGTIRAGSGGHAALASATGHGGEGSMTEIRASTVLPAVRKLVTIRTEDGLNLVGELAVPEHRAPVATLICLHPLPTGGGMMDSHLLRKASYRLPALADLAVLRFNTRGTTSDRGTSEGEFGDGESEALDVAAAVDFCQAAGLPALWLVGWSFGTELALRWGNLPGVQGAILLSPPVRRAGGAEL